MKTHLNFFLLVGIAVYLLGCQPSDQERATELAREYTKAWNSNVPKNVASFYTDDARLIVNGDTMQGKLTVINFAKSFMRNFPDMELTMDSLVADEDTYRYYWSFAGTYEGPYGNGNKVVFSAFEKWTINEEGLIETSVGIYDEASFREQLNFGIE